MREVEYIDTNIYSAPTTEYSCYSQWRFHLSYTADQPFKCSGQLEESACGFSQNKADTEDSCNLSQGKQIGSVIVQEILLLILLHTVVLLLTLECLHKVCGDIIGSLSKKRCCRKRGRRVKSGQTQ